MQKATVAIDGSKVNVSEGHREDPLARGRSLGDDLGGDGLSDPLAAAPVQLDVGGSGTPSGDPSATAGRGVASASDPLPHLDAIQGSFGRHDVSGVRSATGGAAAEAAGAMGAQAFATRGKVGFAGSPDLHTAAHEAAHVVQQRSGVQLKGGVGRSGDVYEQHADQVADAVVSGRSAEGLLDRFAGGGEGGGTSAAVQRLDVKRSQVEKAALNLEGPAFGVPGLKWAVQAEGEREVESELMGGSPETTVKIALAGGLKYDLWFLELGVDLTADVEVKVAGNVSTGEALRKGVTEFARWYGATRLGDVAGKRAELESGFGTRRAEILGAYRELRDLLTGSSFKDFQTGATSWFYFSMSPRAKAEAALNALHNDIRRLFAIAKASGSETQAALLFVDKQALLDDFASAANTDEKNARRNIDRSQSRFLNRFDPAKAQLLSSFDGLDTAKVLARDPDVQFAGTFGARLSGKMGWGGDSGGEGGNEVELQVGAGARVQSGDGAEFELGTQAVLRGKLGTKIGDWGVELKAEREADGDEKVKWKFELEGKREGKLVEAQAERILDAEKVALSQFARSGTLPDTSAVPTALENLLGVVTDPYADADRMVGKGEMGGEAGLGGEVEVEYTRPNAQARWTRAGLKGKVAAFGMGGGKLGLDLGRASALGKVEGSRQKGFKLSASFG